MNRRNFSITSGLVFTGIAGIKSLKTIPAAAVSIKKFHISNKDISIKSPNGNFDSFTIEFSTIQLTTSNLKSTDSPVKLHIDVRIGENNFRNVKKINDIYMKSTDEKTINGLEVNILDEFSKTDFPQPEHENTEKISLTIKMSVGHTDTGKFESQEKLSLSITNTKESLIIEDWSNFTEGTVTSNDSTIWEFTGNANERITTDLSYSSGKSLLLNTGENDSSVRNPVIKYSLQPAQYEKFTFKYNERGNHMRGILMCLENSDGFTFLRFGTDNPQIDVYVGDGDSPEVHDDFSSSYYNEWIEISLRIDWKNMKWTVNWNDLTGNKGSKEFKGDLPEMTVKDVNRVFFRSNGSATESLSNSSHGLDVNIDDITIPSK